MRPDPNHLAKHLAQVSDAEIDAMFTDQKLEQLLCQLESPVDTSSAASVPAVAAFWSDFED